MSTSCSRNLPAAGGRRWKRLIIAAAILKSFGAGLGCCCPPGATFCSGSSHRRRCSNSFSPSVGLNQLLKSSRSLSSPTSSGMVRFL